MCQGTEGRAVSSSWAERVTERRSRGEARSADLSGRKLLRGGGGAVQRKDTCSRYGGARGQGPCDCQRRQKGRAGLGWGRADNAKVSRLEP